MFLDAKNAKESKSIFNRIIDIGIKFKLQKKISSKHLTIDEGKKLITKFPVEGMTVDEVINDFENLVLPYCTNFSSNNFMGFPDAGNSVASLSGALLYNFMQQNLINQSFCGPSATFVEIAVLQWLRETVGYSVGKVNDIWDAGGIITPGGTSSNTIGIMLAREHKFPGCMESGKFDPDRSWLIVPKGIGHYSVKSAQMWIGCGHRLIEVETKDFRYDLDDLKRKLIEYRGRIMCVVAYAGDSRTMTIDNFNGIADLVRSIDPDVWLHADACHGFSLGFSDMLKDKIKGIERFDSITMDPHKVMTTPYVISTLLVKNPRSLETITSKSDLIMKEQFAFGQVTPFLGSRPWHSLKLWFIMKNLGKKGLDQLIYNRHTLACFLAEILENDTDFILLNKVEINSVLFMYKGSLSATVTNLDKINNLNQAIHKRVIEEGIYHLHTFSIPDRGMIQKNAIIFPLRFMSGNPNTTEEDIRKMVNYIRSIGSSLSV